MATDPNRLYEKLKRFQSNTTGAEKPASQPAPEPVQAKPSLPQALLNLPGVFKASNLNGVKQKREEGKEKFLASCGFETVQNSLGKYGFRRVHIPQKQLPHAAREITDAELNLIMRDGTLTGVDAREIAFIDTETTGVAGGTGTVPFLIGVGGFDEQGFYVDQYFMRDYPDEPAVLQDLENALRRYKAVATYNGKTFDVPVIETRFLLNRMKTAIPAMPHIDLLHPARRFWRGALPNCRLCTVELEVLKHDRGDDIPGEQIPYVYFDFVRGQRMARMKLVLNHNAEDISTLAMITARACCILREPQHYCSEVSEIAGAARIFDDAGDTARAVGCLRHALALPGLDLDALNTLRRLLSLHYKRGGALPDAVEIWNAMANDTCDPFALVELAKYFEHTEKEFQRALEYTQKAVDAVLSNREMPIVSLQDTIDSLEHRKTRLLGKIGKTLMAG